MRRRHVFTRLTWYHPLDWYFRVRGYGLSVQPARSCKRLFSERYGYRRAWHVCGLCIKPPGWFTPELLAAVDFIGYDLAAPLPRPPCAHVFLGPFDACLACGTPNPATLR